MYKPEGILCAHAATHFNIDSKLDFSAGSQNLKKWNFGKPEGTTKK